jgi:FdhE protein
VVSREFKELTARRAERARLLAVRYPAAREALTFYAEIASFQETIDPDRPLASRAALIELVADKGPTLLKEAARDLDETSCREALERYASQSELTSPRSFFARVLLQPQMNAAAGRPRSSATGRCPRCGHPPQVGCLRPEGHGTALLLACSLCFAEFPFPRGRCPACGEADETKSAYYSAAPLEQIQLQACETCHRYIHCVSLAKEPEAIPDVDEVAALPLDVWAHEKGFLKLHPNLVGI